MTHHEMQLLAEINQLLTEIAHLKAAQDAFVEVGFEIAAERDAAREERDALLKDAERYRLLRRGQHWSVVNGLGDVLRGAELDSAVDEIIALRGGK